MAKDPDSKPSPVNIDVSRDLNAGQSLSASSPLSPTNHDSSGDTGTPPSPNPATSSPKSPRFQQLNQQASVRLRALKKSSRLKEVATQTRNEIRKHIRQDWEWPAANGTTGTEGALEGSSAGNSGWANGDAALDPADHTNQPERPRNAWSSRINDETLFLERDPGSEPESDLEEDRRLDAERENGAEAPDFRYESPDAVQQTADAEVSMRWRRLEARRKLYVDELKENEGIRNFEARRNAWTGAILAPRLSDQKSYIRDRNVRFKRLDPSLTEPNSPYEFPTRRSLKQRVMDMKREKQEQKSGDETNSNGDADAADEADNEAEKTVLGTDPKTLLQDETLIPYIPIAPPLIEPEHEIRAEIRENTYQHIYSKVVVQGTTPSVPVNLKDMTRALVAGWKADDEWPPKPSMLDPLVGRRKGRGGAQSGKGKEAGGWLRKVLRITGGRGEGEEAPGLIG